jgi:hypothetical protein
MATAFKRALDRTKSYGERQTRALEELDVKELGKDLKDGR